MNKDQSMIKSKNILAWNLINTPYKIKIEREKKREKKRERDKRGTKKGGKYW